MTRKDYILIADHLEQARRPLTFAVEFQEGGDEDYYLALKGFDKAVESVITALRKDNPRFDVDKFRRAVGQPK
jgi:hypothetical protein